MSAINESKILLWLSLPYVSARSPTKDVFYGYVVDYAAFRCARLAAYHNHVLYPIGIEILKYLALRYVTLYLARNADYPPFDITSVLSKGMISACHPHRLRRAAFGLSAAIATEYPTIAFFALMEHHLFFVHHVSIIVFELIFVAVVVYGFIQPFDP